jgi:hypothetical protein
MTYYYKRKPDVTYATELVFSAAALAQRINGKYVSNLDSSSEVRSNRSLITQALGGELEITDLDREHGVAVRELLKTYLFKIVSGQILNEFDSKALALASGDTVTERDIGIIAYYPTTYDRAQETRSIDERLFNCDARYLGAVGKKVSATVEIVKSFYSANYGINFVTGITADNLVVNFVYKNGFKAGDRIAITGKVKSQLDGHVTKLNYVKVVSPSSKIA